MTTYNQQNQQNVRRAWKCPRCPEDSAFIGQKFCVETNILKEHLTPEIDSPFSCSLCKFACLEYKELERHINHYSSHQILRREAIKEGLYTSDSSYFITNASPFASLAVIIASCPGMNRRNNLGEYLHCHCPQKSASIEQRKLSLT